MRVLKALTSRPAALLLWLSIVSLFSFQLWGLQLFRGHFDYQRAGPLGTWISAVMSFGAVSVALWGNYLNQGRYDTDKREKADDLLTDVSAWTEIAIDHRNVRCWEVVMFNRTSYPIYAWHLTIEGIPTIGSEELGPLVPEENRFRLDSDVDTQSRISLPCMFSFKDRKGRQWMVDTHGNKSIQES